MLKIVKLFANRILLIIKIFSLFLIALLTPRFFLLYAPVNKSAPKSNLTKSKFKLGLENISEKNLKKLSHESIGLITNQTGIDQFGNRNIDILLEKGLKIRKIYVPEHGITGNELGGNKIKDTLDKKTQLPIISLYTGDSQFKKFNKKELSDIDTFIFDIQDSGTRHYTYISILYKIMEVASEFDKKVIVLDRPNPLGCIMEGPLVNPEYFSFVSIAPIPLRHALTVGELAKYFNKFRLKKPVKLTIVPMQNYPRTRGLNNNLDMFLSPNIKNINSCHGYSFLGLLGSIKPFDVGINTDSAFQYILLPDSMKIHTFKWYELRNLLASHNIESSLYKYTKQNTGIPYTGLKINITEINNFSSINALLDILNFFKKEGVKFSYIPIFNKLIGTAKFKEYMDGKISKTTFAKEINKELKDFFNKVKELCIYQPLPKIININI